MADLIHASGELEFKDFWQALVWKNFRRRWLFIVFTLLCLLIALLNIAIFGINLINSFMLAGPFIIIGAILFNIYNASNNALKFNRKQIIYTFSPIGYKIETNSSSSQSEWSNLHQVIETEKLFIFFPQPNLLQPIPKRFFDNETETEEFRRLLIFGLNDKAKLKS